MVKCSQLYFFLLCATYWKNVRTQRNRQFEFPNDISKKFLLLLLKIMHHHFKSRNTQFPQNSKQIIKKGKGFFCHWSLFWFWTDDKNIKTLDTGMSLPIAPHTVPQTKIFVAGSCTVTMTKCVLLLAFPLIIVPLFSDQMCGCEKFTIRYRIPRTIMNYRIS